MGKQDLFVSKMKQEGLNDIVINTFISYFNKLLNGEKGKLSKNEIKQPAESNIIHYHDLKNEKTDFLCKLAVIKLNGGLGTSMGLKKAKSLLPVKQGLSFLDIIAQQILFLRKKYHFSIPVLFMNSFNTQRDTLQLLDKYPEIKKQSCPLDFVQNKFPKIRQDNFEPLTVSEEAAGWNPPGHGDIYSCLVQEKIIDQLLDSGIEYIFVSNSDNLGAIADIRILNYMIENKIPFIMEVCNRTEMDKKGGHLAETKDGRLILRETAQCPDDETEDFQNISLYHYFNTNNLWIDLKVLRDKMQSNHNILDLPLIINPKKVDNIPVYQLETAMGSAISLFEGAKAVLVNRDRFAPVKKTQDLLLIWSDIYDLKDDFTLQKVTEIDHLLDLDSQYYGEIDQLVKRFPTTPPSLKECQSFSVKGDISFGNNLSFKGSITLKASQPAYLENIEITNE
ncbi:MAG: UTP--glucose-1-phosphate uridylyltransferase [Candidatus Cloacimonetes bacterium]|nr:UTP--glucose-1-phosphate uridylyltransferase [Candidatus Cloacimonadota bacterium]